MHTIKPVLESLRAADLPKSSKDLASTTGLDDKHTLAAIEYLTRIGAVDPTVDGDRWQATGSLPRTISDSKVGQRVRKAGRSAPLARF